MIRTLCRECGLDPSGSRTDLLLRLSNEMKSRDAYDKKFQKIWAASGKLHLNFIGVCGSYTLLLVRFYLGCNNFPR